MTARAYKTKPPKPQTLESGPWIGVRDAIQPEDSNQKYLASLRNMWLRDLPHVPYADSRPGITQVGGQLGTSTHRYGQRWYRFTKLNGTTYTVAFCGGRVYSYDWGTNAFGWGAAVTNLVTNPEALGTAPWTGSATVTANSTVAPDGSTTADTLTDVSATADRRQSITFTGNGTKYFSLFIKQGTSSVNRVLILDDTAVTEKQRVTITWSGGVPTIVSAGYGGLNAVEGPDARNFYRISFLANSIIAANTNTLYIQPGIAADTTSLIVWGVMANDANTGATYTSPLPGFPSEILTPGELTAAGVTLSPTARVYCVTMANQMVVSDGVNTPWMWDGTPHGGVTKLTNCPVLYGQPAVYYAKLMGIKASEPNTIVWSEEADPTIGYEAGGYNNAWTLGQTDQDRFYALASTDSALYVMRARSITYVIGAVTTDFSTTGTREAVSSTVGTESPASVFTDDSGVYFAGSDRRLYLITSGHQLQEVADGMRVTLSDVPPARLVNVVVCPWTEGDAILFGFPQLGAGDDPSLFVLVSTWNHECIGVWDRFQCTCMDEVADDHGKPAVVHMGGNSATTSQAGFAYRRGAANGPVFVDHFNGTDSSVVRLLTPGFMGYDREIDKHFDQLDLSLLMTTLLSSPTYAYRTSRSEVTTQTIGTITPRTGSGLAGGVYDTSLYDSSVYGGTIGVEQHKAIGLEGTGRWIQPTLTQASGTTHQRFTIQTLAIRAFPLDRRANIY